MDMTLLIQSFVGLISLLAVLIFFLLYAPNKKRARELQQQKEKEAKNKQKTLEQLLAIVRNKRTTSLDLQSAVDDILEYYPEIHNFQPYGEVLLKICKHPNTTKNIILTFNRGLEKRNPRYAKEINAFIAEGLSSR